MKTLSCQRDDLRLSWKPVQVYIISSLYFFSLELTTWSADTTFLIKFIWCPGKHNKGQFSASLSVPSWKCLNRIPSLSRMASLPTVTCHLLSQVNKFSNIIKVYFWLVEQFFVQAGALSKRLSWGSFYLSWDQVDGGLFRSQHFKIQHSISSKVLFFTYERLLPATSKCFH